METLIVSDIHLGSAVSRAKEFGHFLHQIRRKEIVTNELILNGDVFDSWDFRRLKKHHWNVLSELRKLSDQIHVVWINGNHDGPADMVGHILGVDVMEEYRFTSGDKRILCLHGHMFDTLIDAHPRFTHLVDLGYRLLMRLDPSFSLARSAKRASKTFMRNSQRIEERSREYAAKEGCNIVCCGHTHFAVSKPEVGYFNSGCWTESCTFLAVDNGEITLNYYD